MDASLPDPRSAFKAFISRPPLPKQNLGGVKNEAAFLVRRAADYSQAPLEPIEGGLEYSDLSPLRNVDARSKPVRDEHSWPSS